MFVGNDMKAAEMDMVNNVSVLPLLVMDTYFPVFTIKTFVHITRSENNCRLISRRTLLNDAINTWLFGMPPYMRAVNIRTSVLYYHINAFNKADFSWHSVRLATLSLVGSFPCGSTFHFSFPFPVWCAIRVPDQRGQSTNHQTTDVCGCSDVPAPAEKFLWVLCSRRKLFETLIRDHVGALKHCRAPWETGKMV